jgi:hypothetical protein
MHDELSRPIEELLQERWLVPAAGPSAPKRAASLYLRRAAAGAPNQRMMEI